YHGETFYNDTKTGIRRKLGRGTVENFQGRIINADLTGMNLVFPSAVAPYTVCGDRGCNPVMAYSTDGGNTFHGMVYARNIYKPFEDSRGYTIAATKDRVYIEKHRQYDSYVVSYPLIPGFVYDGKSDIPDSKHVEYDTTVPPGLRTPSGQDRITCDASIKPTNPNAPLVR
ncbi:T6SS immunity protein Tli3 family protein, partial [Burkholderia cenocepacia]